MPHNEDTLRNDERLFAGQFLRSKNGLFYALMQEDGNFVVYRSELFKTKPPGYEKTALWSAFPIGSAPGGGTGYHIYMQSDGNLCIYRQNPYAIPYVNPDTAKHLAKDGRALVLRDDGQLFIAGIWGSNGSDSYGEVELEKVEYDTAAAKITSLGPPKAAVSSIARNDLDEEEIMHVTVTYTKTTTTSWTVSTTLKVGAKTTLKTGIPGIVEGQVEVSTEFTQGFEWNKSNTETQTLSPTLDIKVAPHKAVIAKLTWSESSIDLPYRTVGKVKFNGYPEKLPVHLEGIYKGTASHNMETSWKYVTKPANSLTNLAPSAKLAAVGDDDWTAIKPKA